MRAVCGNSMLPSNHAVLHTQDARRLPAQAEGGGGAKSDAAAAEPDVRPRTPGQLPLPMPPVMPQHAARTLHARLRPQEPARLHRRPTRAGETAVRRCRGRLAHSTWTRPVGCWCTGCAPLPPRAPAQGRPPVLADAGRARAVAEALTRWRAVPAQVLRPVRRDGGGPAAAAVLRLQHRALLLAIVPKGRLARGPQGRMPAPASARRADAAAGGGHAIASEAWVM